MAQGDWQTTLQAAFPGTEVALRGVPGRPWTYRANTIDTVSLHDVSAGAQRIVHRAQPRWPRRLSLMVQLEGRCRVELGERTVELEAGRMLLADVERHLALEADADYRQAFVLIPWDRLGSIPARAVGATSDPSSPIDALLRDHVAGLVEAARLLDARQAGLAVDALLGHVRLSTIVSASLGSPEVGRVERALAYIDEHLGDPELGPRTVAAAQHVGRRHLDALFRRSGRTLAQVIQERRLEAVARALRSPNAADATILEIGLRCGFSSAAHLSRAFKQRFGVSPSQWRR